MSEKIILVVEDNSDIRLLIDTYLSELNFEIHSALNGEDGVEKYKELMEKGKKPDIVVMDLNLTQFGPGEIDGVEATKRIIQMDRDAVIYGFTAYFDTQWSKALANAGAKGVIGRPVGFAGFREMVKKILAGEKVNIPKY